MRHALSGLLALTLLSGCGSAATVTAASRAAQGLQARTDAGLHAGVVELRKQRFGKLDLNGDGALTRAEASDDALRLPGVIETFADYDTSGDGRIVPDEFLREDVIQYWMNELRPRIQTMFLKLDTNRDFKLTGKELDSIKLYFSLFPELHGSDLNQDGEVPFGEFEDAYVVTLPRFQPQGPEQSLLKKLPAVR
jgi:Ca2+-binding EF-hand superfamily protein